MQQPLVRFEAQERPSGAGLEVDRITGKAAFATRPSNCCSAKTSPRKPLGTWRLMQSRGSQCRESPDLYRSTGHFCRRTGNTVPRSSKVDAAEQILLCVCRGGRNVAGDSQKLADVLDALIRQRASHADVLVKLDALLQLTEDLANHPPSATIEAAAMRIRRRVIKLCGAQELCSLRVVHDLIDDSITELEAAGASG